MSKKKSGCTVGGKWITYYDMGRNAYDNRQAYSEAQCLTWKQGWRAGRDSDMKLLDQCQTKAVRDSITTRMMQAMGITESNMMAA